MLAGSTSLTMAPEGDGTDQKLTLHDVASAGISKAIDKRRPARAAQLEASHSILPKATWGQADAPQCGGLAAHRDDEEATPAEAPDGLAARRQADSNAAQHAFPDLNGDGWAAEEAGDEELEQLDDLGLDWEADADGLDAEVCVTLIVSPHTCSTLFRFANAISRH